MRVRFHPQAWQNDYAVSVDPQGATDFDVEGAPDIKSDTDRSDRFQRHPNAPEWVKNWSGPFWIEVLEGHGEEIPDPYDRARNAFLAEKTNATASAYLRQARDDYRYGSIHEEYYEKALDEIDAYLIEGAR